MAYLRIFVGVILLMPTVRGSNSEMVTINNSSVRELPMPSPSESISVSSPWMRFSPEYVRCFCNLPTCISTGYMCKSNSTGCFSNVLDQANEGDYKGIHGCLELLHNRNQRKSCKNISSSSSKSYHRKKFHSTSLFLCCYHDMCNHADSPDTKVLLNETILETFSEVTDNHYIDSVATRQDLALYTDSEVWFRAATIAVPICGVVILLALILLAVKLLRTESLNSPNRNHKLGILPYSDRKLWEKRKTTYQHHNTIYPDLFSKDSHHNPVYLNETEDLLVQSYIPLLNQEDIKYIEKNCDKVANAKLNFINGLRPCTVTNCEQSQHLFHKIGDFRIDTNATLENNHGNLQGHISKTYDKECIS